MIRHSVSFPSRFKRPVTVAFSTYNTKATKLRLKRPNSHTSAFLDGITLLSHTSLCVLSNYF